MSHPIVNLSSDEEKRWEDIQRLRVTHPSCRGRVTGLFWRKAVDAFRQGNLICSSILAGITAELAHKTKLREQGAEMKYRNRSPKAWGILINKYEKDEKIKEKATKIKDDYRNVWVHADLEEIEKHLKIKGSPIPSDPELKVGFASADSLELLELTAQLLRMLGYVENA